MPAKLDLSFFGLSLLSPFHQENNRVGCPPALEGPSQFLPIWAALAQRDCIRQSRGRGWGGQAGTGVARGRGREGGGTLVLGKARRPEEEASRSQQVRETVGQEGSEERGS